MQRNTAIARIGRLAGFATTLALVSAVIVAPALSAGRMKPQSNGQRSAGENCQAKPDRDKSANSNDKTGSITKKLDECGGVLQPPDVNDPALVKPAPDTGSMPVIKPGQVPDQTPKQQ
jgi:hypothetical protein